MSITVNLYYSGTNGSARRFAEEMEKTGVAAIVPHNAMADSLMDDISLFIEENTEAEILEEEREIR